MNLVAYVSLVKRLFIHTLLFIYFYLHFYIIINIYYKNKNSYLKKLFSLVKLVTLNLTIVLLARLEHFSLTLHLLVSNLVQVDFIKKYFIDF